MSFMKKLADNAATGGTNNQGLQFGGADESPYGAAAQFSPTGIPSYQPTGGQFAPPKKGKKKNMAAIIMGLSMSKCADDSMMLAGGNMPNTEPTIATQLKWESNTAPKTENLGLDKSGPKPKGKKSMGFVKGMMKEAALAHTLKAVGGELSSGAKAYAKGLHATGSHTLSDTLSLKGLKHIGDAAKAGVKTPEGRKGMAAALGKATPSLAAGAAYVIGGKKLYDKSIGNTPPYMENNYAQY